MTAWVRHAANLSRVRSLVQGGSALGKSHDTTALDWGDCTVRASETLQAQPVGRCGALMRLMGLWGGFQGHTP